MPYANELCEGWLNRTQVFYLSTKGYECRQDFYAMLIGEKRKNDVVAKSVLLHEIHSVLTFQYALEPSTNLLVQSVGQFIKLRESDFDIHGDSILCQGLAIRKELAERLCRSRVLQSVIERCIDITYLLIQWIPI